MIRLLLVLLLALPLPALADDARPHLRTGAKLFSEGKFAEALQSFLAAELADPKNLAARYNAVTAMAQNDPAAADKKLGEDFELMAPAADLRGMAAYNAGTATLAGVIAADRANQLMAKENELNTAIRWLRQSLLDVSSDTDTKNNLEIANRLKEKLEKQKQQNQDNQQDQQDNQDQQNKNQDDRQKQQDEQQKQQEKGKEKDQQNQKQREQDNPNQPQQDQQQPQDQQPQEREISEATAKNLLQAAKDAEKRAMKMLREQQNRKNRKRAPDGRDW